LIARTESRSPASAERGLRQSPIKWIRLEQRIKQRIKQRQQQPRTQCRQIAQLDDALIEQLKQQLTRTGALRLLPERRQRWPEHHLVAWREQPSPTEPCS